MLKKADFVDSRFSVDFGVNKRATFINVDETFKGSNDLGRVFRINIQIESFNDAGTKINGDFASSVIGIGQTKLAGIMLSDPNDTELLGQILNFDNIERCVIRLYE
jgi:hypothetical protein